MSLTQRIEKNALRLAPGGKNKHWYGTKCPEATAPEIVACVTPHLQIATASGETNCHVSSHLRPQLQFPAARPLHPGRQFNPILRPNAKGKTFVKMKVQVGIT